MRQTLNAKTQRGAERGKGGKPWPGRLRWTLLGLLLGALLGGGCGSSAAPQPLIFGPAPWPDGEQSIYTLTDADGQQAGSAVFTLSAAPGAEEPAPEAPDTGAAPGTGDGAGDGANAGAWQLVRTITALGSQEIMTVTMDATGFRPQSSQLQRTGPEGSESVDAIYTGGQVDLTLNTRQNIMTVQREQIPSDGRETVTLPMLLRSLPLAQGYATQVNAYLPVAAQLERITVRVTGEETVQTAAGSFSTWVIELDAGDAQSKAWIAQEAPYPLVRYIDGRNDATLELSELR